MKLNKLPLTFNLEGLYRLTVYSTGIRMWMNNYRVLLLVYLVGHQSREFFFEEIWSLENGNGK